ncbi:MAG TPA: FtsX-like permease family protein, partial [Chryseolinea sp.]|nr:FtsX-like permease family protein [Chryseolinea sp.]
PLGEVPFRVFDNDVFIPKSKYVLQAFRAVAILVLLMAWVNYLNLKLSTQSKRMKELATRKAAGAVKIDFVKQFLIESLVINCLAVVVALTLVQLLKHSLEILFQFYMPEWNSTTFSSLLIIAGVMVLGIFIAGLHPAVCVWRMSTEKIFRQKGVQQRSFGFTQVSTVLQYMSAIGLIVWMFCVVGQVNFVTRDSWGLDRNRVVVVDLPLTGDDISAEINSLKNELLSTTQIEDVALSTTIAGDLIENAVNFSRTDTTGLWAVTKSDGGVDERFIPFYGLKVLAGRNFLKDNPADRRTVILSQQAARTVGWEPEEAIGKVVSLAKYSWRSVYNNAEVIGVIADHRYAPLYLETGLGSANPGTILTYGNYLYPGSIPERLSIRVDSSNPKDVLEVIEKLYHEIFPGQIFRWYFLQDHMNVHYKSEMTARNQITLFTAITIGIACLGLLGMIANKVVEKNKEIGIRKVLGADLLQIAQILLNTTLKQISLATAVGIPVAYYITQQYLEKFTERISLQWWHYALPVGILVAIMFITIASELWRAARTNPVETLKHE